MDEILTWRDVIDEAADVHVRLDVRRVAAHAAGVSIGELSMQLDEPVTQRGIASFDGMLIRLNAGEPLQYVLGSWGFRHLDLMVDKRVLIPRPETEEVVEEALRLAAPLPRPLTCVDLGTGSGAIALSLALELKGEVTVFGTDFSHDALAVASANLTALGTVVAPKVRLVQGSWWDALPAEIRGAVGLCVANPPYVATGETLPANVVDWEPSDALFAGPDGLDDYRAIVADAPSWLMPRGVLVMEIGSALGVAVSELCVAAGLTDVRTTADLSGLDRIVTARRPA